MSEFWSFVVFLPQGEVSVPEASLVLEKGSAGFNVVLEDVLSFEKKLTEAGVRIIKKSRLDEYELVDPPKEIENAHHQSGLLVQAGSSDLVSDEEQGSSHLFGGDLPTSPGEHRDSGKDSD